MAPRKNLTFEDRMRRLQTIVNMLENGAADGELPLEESVRLYREGIALSRACREQLDKIRNEISLLTADGSLESFSPVQAEQLPDEELGDEDLEDEA